VLVVLVELRALAACLEIADFFHVLQAGGCISTAAVDVCFGNQVRVALIFMARLRSAEFPERYLRRFHGSISRAILTGNVTGDFALTYGRRNEGKGMVFCS